LPIAKVKMPQIATIAVHVAVFEGGHVGDKKDQPWNREAADGVPQGHCHFHRFPLFLSSRPRSSGQHLPAQQLLALVLLSSGKRIRRFNLSRIDILCPRATVLSSSSIFDVLKNNHLSHANKSTGLASQFHLFSFESVLQPEQWHCR